LIARIRAYMEAFVKALREGESVIIFCFKSKVMVDMRLPKNIGKSKVILESRMILISSILEVV
jgi:hypothetical protein